MRLGGNDNRTFRLGGRLLVRLPSAAGYAAAVGKEQRWLPVLANAALPLPIPSPVAAGVPGLGYRFPWSVYRWIEGRTAAAGPIGDLTVLATALAGFLVALQHVDPTGGPPPGPHNSHRGGELAGYADETATAIRALGDDTDGPGGVGQRDERAVDGRPGLARAGTRSAPGWRSTRGPGRAGGAGRCGRR